jgi:hypothetical protein
MTRTVNDPNPQLSWLDDKPTKDKIAALTQRALDAAQWAREAPPLSPEQEERERWQFEANSYAEAHPLYAAARAAAQHYAIVPLEPSDTKPLLSPSEATRDERVILDWWRDHPDANVGIVTGRPNNLVAMEVQDWQAAVRLRRLAEVEHYNEDRDAKWTEHRGYESGFVRYVSTRQVRVRAISRWESKRNPLLPIEVLDPNPVPERCFLVWAYHPVVSGMDAWEFKARRVIEGVQLLGPNEVIPWAGSRFEGDLMIAAPPAPLSPMPTWLAQKVGKPRSRKAMTAAREAWEAAERAAYGFSDAELLKLIEAREFAQGQAQTAAVKAKATAERLAKRDELPEDLPPVVEEAKEEAKTGGWGKR